MARSSLQLIDALKKAAKKISDDKDNYNWRAIGACNCGNLVQVVTNYTAKQISDFGIKKHGDWQSISLLYNEESEYEIDRIIKTLLDMGMELEDFTHLENLNNPKVLSYIGGDINLKRDEADHAVLYLKSWAKLLEEELLQNISLKDIKEEAVMA